jgi:hypothetical protein
MQCGLAFLQIPDGKSNSKGRREHFSPYPVSKRTGREYQANQQISCPNRFLSFMRHRNSWSSDRNEPRESSCGMLGRVTANHVERRFRTGKMPNVREVR